MNLSQAMKSLIGSAYSWWVGAPPVDHTRRQLLLGLSTAAGVLMALGPAQVAELLQGDSGPIEFAEPARPLRTVLENQFYGIGAVSLKPGEERAFRKLINAQAFTHGVTARAALRALVLDATDPGAIEVTRVLVDGQPIFGTAVRPLAHFAPSARANLICTPPLPFDWIEVWVRNVSRSEQIVSGGCILDVHRSLAREDHPHQHPDRCPGRAAEGGP